MVRAINLSEIFELHLKPKDIFNPDAAVYANKTLNGTMDE